jgi:hypothetical protein
VADYTYKMKKNVKLMQRQFQKSSFKEHQTTDNKAASAILKMFIIIHAFE